MNFSFPLAIIAIDPVVVSNNNDLSVNNENLGQTKTERNKKVVCEDKPVAMADKSEGHEEQQSTGPTTASKVKSTDQPGDLSYVSGSSCPSASKIPISTGSTLRRDKRRIRKTKLPSVGSNKSSDRLFDVLADESEAMSPTNYSDGYIDRIISQSCQKSTENLLDSVDASEKLLESTADDLDDSGDVFFNEEQQESVCDSIISKFLAVTTHEKMKNVDIISPVENFKSPLPALSPIMNFNSDLKLLQAGAARVQTSTPTSGGEEGHGRSAENKIDINNSVQVLEKGHKGFSAVIPGVYETSGGGQLSKIDYVLKSYEDKSVLLESQIESLENQLKSAVAASKENAQNCDEALRKLNLNESYLAQVEDTKGDLEIKVGAMKHDINDKEDELRLLKSKFTKLEQEFDTQVKNTGDVEVKLKESKDTIEGFEHKVKSLEGKLKLSEEKNDRFEEELKLKGGFLESNAMELEGSKREVEVLKNKLNKIDEDYNALHLKLTKTGNEIDDKDVKIRDLLLMIKQLQEEQKEKIDKVEEEENKEQEKEEFRRKRAMFENSPKPATIVKETCKSCEKLAAKLKTVEQEITEGIIKLSAKEVEIDRLKESNNALNELEGMLDSKIDELMSTVKTKEELITSQEHVISCLRNKNEGLSENIDSAEKNAKKSDEEVAGKMVEYEKLEFTVKSSNYQICELEEKVTTIEKENYDLKSINNEVNEENRKKDQIILKTKEALNTVEVLVEENKDSLKKLEADLEASLFINKSLESQVKINDEVIVKLTALKEENQRTISELELKAEAVEKSLEVVKQENFKLTDEVEMLVKKHEELVKQTNIDVAEIMEL